MIWFLERPARFIQERAALIALAENETWLTIKQWRFAEGCALCVDADIRVGDAVRSVTLTYPAIFPDAPPSVNPVDPEGRWSDHQYGPAGELCLEYRPDNWQASVTGADMLRSAYKLLSGEAPNSAEPSTGVPSAHRATPGQELRAKRRRITLTQAVIEKFQTVPQPAALTLFGAFAEDCLAWTPVKLSEPDGSTWLNPDLPAGLVDQDSWAGFVIAVRLDDARFDHLGDEAAKGARHLRELFLGNAAPFEKPETLIIQYGQQSRVFRLYPEDDTVCEVAVIAPEPAPRQPLRNDALADKRIAIIGCGSLGSKAAITLARAGARRFLLVDDDILQPENLIRHNTDWRMVGHHKADAIADTLRALYPGMDVVIRRHRLGGQEASGSLDTLIAALSKCDVIAEATGSDEAFNYAAHVATRYQVPMLWARVFAGGYGGLLARSRPGLEPTPLDARARIEEWCSNPEFPKAPKPEQVYGAMRADNVPMVADDADVSVIAGHFSRMLIDTVLGSGPSYFEYSAYLIGLRKEWIFQAAFQTFPLDLGAASDVAAEDADASAMEAATRAALEIISAQTQ